MPLTTPVISDIWDGDRTIHNTSSSEKCIKELSKCKGNSLSFSWVWLISRVLEFYVWVRKQAHFVRVRPIAIFFLIVFIIKEGRTWAEADNAEVQWKEQPRKPGSGREYDQGLWNNKSKQLIKACVLPKLQPKLWYTDGICFYKQKSSCGTRLCFKKWVCWNNEWWRLNLRS